MLLLLEYNFKTTIMKTRLFLAAYLLFGIFLFGQDSYQLPIKTQLITLNPSQEIKNTAGLNLGIFDDYQTQKISGINVQLNPITLIYLLAPTEIEVPKEGTETVTINGIHLSTGGMTDGKALNGVGLSMYHIAQETNGITLNGFNNNSGKLNGLHISGLNNSAEKGNGILVALSNSAGKYNGLQLGILNDIGNGNGLQVGLYNRSTKLKGVQIGLINKTKDRKGFQLGFWNKNAKRTLPLINF